MGKIKVLKSKWIKIEDHVIDLNKFSKIQKGEFGIFEGTDDRYFIEVTEHNKNQDGSDNRYMIATYKENEKELWEEDYESIITSLNS